MIVLDIYEADDFGAADKVERIEGTYNGKAFELDRVYSDYNEEDDTYGLIEVSGMMEIRPLQMKNLKILL